MFHWSKCYFNPHVHKMDSWGPKHHFSQPVLIQKCQKAQSPCVPLFSCQKTYYNFSEFTRNCQVILWYHMFSNINMEEYTESELSSIFWVKTGCQIYRAWDPRGSMLICLCSVISLWRNIQMFWTKLLDFSVFLVK